jgi:hypothetical protein
MLSSHIKQAPRLFHCVTLKVVMLEADVRVHNE